MSAGYHEEDVVGKAVDWRLLARLWTYVRPHVGWLVFSTVALGAISWLDLLPAKLLKDLLDGPLAARLAGSLDGDGFGLALRDTVLLFAGAVTAAFLLRRFQMIAVGHLGQRVMQDLRMAVFSHVQRQPLSFYDRNPVGRLVTRTVHDVESLNEVLVSGVDALFHDLFKIALIAGWLLFVNWRLALVTFAVLPPLFWIARLFRAGNRTATPLADRHEHEEHACGEQQASDDRRHVGRARRLVVELPQQPGREQREQDQAPGEGNGDSQRRASDGMAGQYRAPVLA